MLCIVGLTKSPVSQKAQQNIEGNTPSTNDLWKMFYS